MTVTHTVRNLESVTKQTVYVCAKKVTVVHVVINVSAAISAILTANPAIAAKMARSQSAVTSAANAPVFPTSSAELATNVLLVSTTIPIVPVSLMV